MSEAIAALLARREHFNEVVVRNREDLQALGLKMETMNNRIAVALRAIDDLEKAMVALGGSQRPLDQIEEQDAD